VADDSEGRERGTDELFEDLDKFFAPIHDVDWHEEGEEEEPAPPPAAADTGIPWREPAATPEGAGDAEEDEPAGLSSDEPAGLDIPEDLGGGVGQPTQELSGNEWDDLRSRFGRDDQDEGAGGEEPDLGGQDAYSFMRRFLPDDDERAAGPGEPPAATEPEAGPGPLAKAVSAPETAPPGDAIEGDLGTTEAPGEFPAGEGAGPAEPGEEPSETWTDEEAPGGELTVDALRKAPEAYRDLPGPADDEVAEEAEPLEGVDPALQAPGALDESELGGVTPQEGAPFAAEGEDGEDEDGFFPDEEAPPGGSEAAAANIAEAIWQSGELPVVSGQGPETAEGDDFLEPGPDPLGDELEGGFEQPAPGPRTIKVGAGDTFGPSWQEATSVDVAAEGEVEPAAPGRNLPLALLVGVALAVIGLGSLAISKAAFTVVAAIVVAIAQVELYTAVRRRGYQPAVPVGLVFGILTIAAAYLKGEAAMLAMVALAVPFTFVWYMTLPPIRRRNALANIAMTLFPLVYVPFLAGFLLLTLAVSKALMITVLALAVGYDVAAYAVGSLFGERPMAPSISPSKTWEGLIGATLILIIPALVFLPQMDVIGSTMRAVGLAVVIAAFAPLGDLAESLMKRDLGIKDMGTILPGHGGVLDRIDSLLFAAPAAWYFFRIFF